MDEPALRNDPLDLDQLPRVRDDDFVSLEPAYLKSRLTAHAVALGVVIAAATVVLMLVSRGRPAVAAVGAVAALVVIVGAALATLETRRSGYLIRDHDVSFRDGIITRAVVSVPYVRVQNVSVERSGIERVFGLASVTIRTAGGLLGSVTIPGLDPARAETLKEAILQRAALEST